MIEQVLSSIEYFFTTTIWYMICAGSIGWFIFGAINQAQARRYKGNPITVAGYPSQGIRVGYHLSQRGEIIVSILALIAVMGLIIFIIWVFSLPSPIK